MSAPIVGIIANPVSARDIRRVIAHAGNLQIVDRANIVLRILAGQPIVSEMDPQPRTIPPSPEEADLGEL